MTENKLFTQFTKEIAENDIVLYMKGTPDMPMCGFSAAAVAAFQNLGATNIYGVNVLEDENIRQSIKEFSEWPTLPQIYVKGEFIGGCDIIREMYETGELKDLLAEKGVIAA